MEKIRGAFDTQAGVLYQYDSKANKMGTQVNAKSNSPEGCNKILV
jgi:hypothetical protein